MIKIYDQVPQVYSNASRDFQYLGWLFNVVLNYSKHNVDSLKGLPSDTTDPRITELLAMTLGFKVKRKYDQKQLAALVSILPRILKVKGTKKALELAGNALINAAEIPGEFSCTANGATLEAYLPAALTDTSLFMDLLPYIMPAGMTCKIVRKTKVSTGQITKVYYDDSTRIQWHHDKTLAGLFNPTAGNTDKNYAHANFIPVTDSTGEIVLDTDGNIAEYTTNIGLMDNNIIPTLSTDTHDQ